MQKADPLNIRDLAAWLSERTDTHKIGPVLINVCSCGALNCPLAAARLAAEAVLRMLPVVTAAEAWRDAYGHAYLHDFQPEPSRDVVAAVDAYREQVNR